MSFLITRTLFRIFVNISPTSMALGFIAICQSSIAGINYKNIILNIDRMVIITKLITLLDIIK